MARRRRIRRKPARRRRRRAIARKPSRRSASRIRLAPARRRRRRRNPAKRRKSLRAVRPQDLKRAVKNARVAADKARDTVYDLRRRSIRAGRAQSEMVRRRAAARRKAAANRRRAKRKNPMNKWVGRIASGSAALVVSNFLVRQARAMIPAGSALDNPQIVNYGVPAAGALAAWWLGKKRKLGLDKDRAKWAMGGFAISALLNAGHLDAILANLPGPIGKAFRLGSGLGTIYAGAAGVGRYLAVDNSGMGRYLAVDDSMSGVGRYVTEGALSGLGEADRQLIDEVASSEPLSPVEAEAENILAPGMPVVRAMPQHANRLQHLHAGEILGESSQVPGTVLVATTVAGRDIRPAAGAQPAGYDYPAAGIPFGPKPIGPAQNINVSPHGVFSRGVFSTRMPQHGQISV